MSRFARRGVAPAFFFLLLLSPGCIGWLDDPPVAVRGLSWSIAGAILLDDAFPHIVVEVDYASSYVPSQTALNAVHEMLRVETRKHSITILPPTRVEPLPGVHTNAEVEAYHLATRSHGKLHQPWENSTFYLHILYLNGHMEETRMLGIYHGSGDITILSDLIPTMVGPYAFDAPNQIGAEQAERKSLIHELGHAFGLVNCGVPMVRPHEDPRSPCHSTNPRSVMSYWNWTRPEDDPVQSVKDTIEVGWRFDEDDRADLDAFRRTGKTFSSPPAEGPRRS